jgi:hypothetical protein
VGIVVSKIPLIWLATRTIVTGSDDAGIYVAVGTVVVLRPLDSLGAQNVVGALGSPVEGRCGGGIWGAA